MSFLRPVFSYVRTNIYLKINIKIYINLPRNAIFRLSHLRRGDSQGQETFLAPSETCNYDTQNWGRGNPYSGIL